MDLFKISNYFKLVFSGCPSLSFFSFWIVCFQICRRKHLVFQTFSIIDDYIFLLLYIYIQFPNIYLGLEYVGPSKRMLTGLPIHIFFAFGLLYIAGLKIIWDFKNDIYKVVIYIGYSMRVCDLPWNSILTPEFTPGFKWDNVQPKIEWICTKSPCRNSAEGQTIQ
jgi:hypothetical protein